MDNFRDSYFNVTWDLTQKHLRGTFWGKQYDTGRGFAVTIVEGGKVTVPSTETVRLKWEKLDGTEGYVTAVVVDGKFLIENIDQMFTVHCAVRSDLEIWRGGKVISSITFYVSVEKAVAVDGIESSSQFTALQTAIATVDGLDANITEVKSQLAQTTNELNDPLRRKIYTSFLNPTPSDGYEGDMWFKLHPLYNFETDTVGQIPNGWSILYGDGYFTVQNIDNTKAVYSGSRSNTVVRSVLKNDDLDIVTDSDLKVDVYVTKYNSVPSLASRIGGVTGAETMYVARFSMAQTKSFDIFKYVDGVGTTLISESFTADLETWYTLRFKTEGNNLYAKWWDRSQPEPVGWNLTAVDNDITNGFVGVFDAFIGPCYFDNWEMIEGE